MTFQARAAILGGGNRELGSATYSRCTTQITLFIYMGNVTYGKPGSGTTVVNQVQRTSGTGRKNFQPEFYETTEAEQVVSLSVPGQGGLYLHHILR